MILKLTGALLILSGCGGYGFYLAASHLREIRTLEKLGRVINAMLWELQFKQTPLPDLCRWTASETTGILRQLFEDLATELDRQVSPNAKKCMYAALAKHPSIPAVSTSILQQLGESLGKFDLRDNWMLWKRWKKAAEQIWKRYGQDRMFE